MIEYYAISEIGLKRPSNQDAYLTIANDYGDFLALVCDGIGGSKAGDVASKEVVNYFSDNFKKSGPFKDIQNIKDYLKKEINNANKKIFDLSNSDISYKGMGTTVTGILISDNNIVTFNVGDSRVYAFDNNEAIRLTVDHSLVNQLLAKGEITYEESINHPMKHYLIRAVGIFDKVDVDIFNTKKHPYYVLCSDGLCGYVSDEEMSQIIFDENLISCKDKCAKLLDLALLKGGYDNITIVVIKR